MQQVQSHGRVYEGTLSKEGEGKRRRGEPAREEKGVLKSDSPGTFWKLARSQPRLH